MMNVSLQELGLQFYFKLTELVDMLATWLLVRLFDLVSNHNGGSSWLDDGGHVCAILRARWHTHQSRTLLL